MHDIMNAIKRPLAAFREWKRRRLVRCENCAYARRRGCGGQFICMHAGSGWRQIGGVIAYPVVWGWECCAGFSNIWKK